jgi:predicted O-methyltransferase YrrM
MQGTTPQKVGRLMGNLLTHPEYLPRYVPHNVIRHPSPLELELPWFSYAVIDFLKDYLQPHMRVCEYGSGGSTLFFCKRVQSVYSIEDNPEWFERVTSTLKIKGITNVEVVLCPFDFKNPAGFERSAYLHALNKGDWDVIVVDTSEEWTQVRPAVFAHAENFIKPGGIIVVDDSWRYPILREKNRAKRCQVFQSVGPGRPGVTSTDVFFY